MALSKETQKALEDIAFQIGLCEMALIYKKYEHFAYPSKEVYVNRIKELRAKILFTYMLKDFDEDMSHKEEELQDI